MKNIFLFSLVIMFVVSLMLNNSNNFGKKFQKAEVLGAVVSAQTIKPVDYTFNSSAVDFRMTLNNLLREYSALGVTALKALYEDVDNTRLLELLNENERKLGEKVKYVYGETTGEKFMQLWTEHINEYQNYTLAKRDNDAETMDSARKNLEKIADDLGRLLDRSGRKLEPIAVKDHFLYHINLTLGTVDAVAEGNHTGLANLTKEGYEQASKFADLVARGMIEDKPERFE